MHPNVIFKKHRQRVSVVYFVSGIFVGFLLSYIFLLLATSSSITTTSLLRSSTLSIQRGDGWNPIHVFYGKIDHISYHSTISKDYFDSVVWYSQARQDEVVAALLRNQKNGYFVDLAANDPIKISNTYALETQLDWKGLCIEPNPAYWPGLSYRTNCHIVGAVIGSDRLTPVQFRFPKALGPRGGIVGNGFDNQPEIKSKLDDEKPRYTVSLLEIFEKFETPSVIDYMSLDVGTSSRFIRFSVKYQTFMSIAICLIYMSHTKVECKNNSNLI
jgi:hypothetical protein